MPTDLLVIGAGITGLVAAYDAARAGAAVTLVEASGHLGGKVRTEHTDGFLIEAGPDSFVGYKPAAKQLAEELGLADNLISPTPPRQVWLRRSTGRDPFVPMPDGMGLVLPTRVLPFARTRLFTWPQKLRALGDLARPRILPEYDVAVGEFLRRRLGPAVVDRLADPLFGGIYGTTLDELSLDAVLPMLRRHEQEQRSLILASLAAGRAARASKRAAGSPFLSLCGGMQSLIDALVDRLDGVQVHTGTAAVAMSTTDTGTEVTLADGTLISARQVVLTCSASAAAALLAAETPTAAELVGGVRHASTAVVSLGYPEGALDRLPAGHGFLEAGPDKAVFSGVTVSSAKWAGRAPDGQVLLRVFVPDRSAAVLDAPDDNVIALVRDQITGIVGGSRVVPTVQRIDRWPAAMPVYTVGHLERMAALEAALGDRPQWQLAGAALRGVGMPDCVAQGRAAAAAAVTALG